MIISIIGTNGMLSTALTDKFIQKGYQVNVLGKRKPDYSYSSFHQIDLLHGQIDYHWLLDSEVIIYAAGAGVQAALQTDPSLMYALNVDIPIAITIQLKKRNYKGVYISFGSYMEIGVNPTEDKEFQEQEVVCSNLPVTNDYALSKRLYSRYMNDLHSEYHHYHFILPNMFSYNDRKPGTRLIPYILQYIYQYKAGENPQEPKFSAGLQLRQYILLEDMIPVLEKSLEFDIPSGIYNVGGGEFMSIKSLIRRIFKFFDVPCKEDFFGKETRRDNDMKSLRISGKKLMENIHYLPDSKIEKILL